MEKKGKRARVIGPEAAICIVAFAIGLVFVGSPGEGVELLFHKAKALYSQALGREQELHCTLVVLDAKSRARLGISPETAFRLRMSYPRYVDRCAEAGAAVVFFDIFFDTGVAGEAELARSFAVAGNVIIGGETGSDGGGSGPLGDAAAAIADMRIMVADGAYAIRVPAGRLAAKGGLAARVIADLYLRRTGSRPLYSLEARTRDGFWIDYGFPLGQLPTVSFVDVLDGNVDVALLAGRIIMTVPDYGWNEWNATGAVDRFSIPGASSGGVPGTVVQAYAVETLLSGRRIMLAPFWLNALALAVFVSFLWILGGRSRSTLRFALMPLALGIALLSQFQLYSACGFSLNSSGFVISAAVVLTLASARVIAGNRARLRRAMGFDPRLYEAFLASVRSLPEQTVEKDATIVVADIRGYTEYTAANSSRITALVIRECLLAMEREIYAQGGYVNKYVGDEIVAVFGFPLAEEGTQARALRASLAMLDAFAALRAGWTLRGIPPLRNIGIGVDSGTVSFAEMGGTTRSQFDVVGNAVNGAARLEGFCKEADALLVVSDEVFAAIAGAFPVFEQGARRIDADIRGQGRRAIHVHGRLGGDP